MPTAEALATVPVTLEMMAPEATQHPTNVLASTSSSANVASTLCNLLPIAGIVSQPSGTGIYIGKGLPPVPPKLAKKIRQWEFVDMAELLPEFWSLPSVTKSEAFFPPVKEGNGSGITGPVFCNICGGPHWIKPSSSPRADGLFDRNCKGQPGFWQTGLG